LAFYSALTSHEPLRPMCYLFLVSFTWDLLPRQHTYLTPDSLNYYLTHSELRTKFSAIATTPLRLHLLAFLSTVASLIVASILIILTAFCLVKMFRVIFNRDTASDSSGSISVSNGHVSIRDKKGDSISVSDGHVSIREQHNRSIISINPRVTIVNPRGKSLPTHYICAC
jgi:hypothetical protein